MRYLKPYSLSLFLGAVLSLLINVSVLAKPYLIKYIIDDCLVSGRNQFSIPYIAAAYFFIVLFGACFEYTQKYLMTYIGQSVMFNIRNELFHHVQMLSMPFFDKNSTGRILTRITNDVESVSDLFSGVIINIFKDIIMLIGIVSVMFYLDVKTALFSVGCVPVIMLITLVYRIAARKNFIKMKGMLSKINGFLAENISGMKLVQIFHREKEKRAELENLDREYFKYSLREIILHGFSRPAVDIINNLTIAVVIWVCFNRILSSQLQIGILVAFITYIKQFFNPIRDIADIYTSIQSSIISSERIFEVLDTKESLEDPDPGIRIKKLKGEVEFKNVWFAYNSDNWVLKDISFKIEPGETVAFVGATGSGKSTIINLLGRFYNIQKGEILIDGININRYNLTDLRRRIAVVMQDVFLFSGDIASNIRLGDASISDSDIKEAAKYVCADEFIQALPNGFSEEVREGGSNFSSGQKQLISFARAVAFKPSILVLDEATSNIDTQTEIMIQNAMSKISSGKTSIIIAHRLSTIKNADKIIVIHKGRIKETGTHEQLMDKKGLYYNLCKMRKTDIPKA
jgi:ATP-binding cassette subfamily B protein